MYLKYTGKEETTVWKIDGKKSIVNPWEVFETNERIGKQYIRWYKHLFEESDATQVKSTPKKEEKKETKPAKKEEKKEEKKS